LLQSPIPAGHPANATYGFIEFLYQLISRRNPRLIACAFDESLGTSARNEIYPDYKANRSPAPAELKHQFKLCKTFTEAIGIAALASGRLEADIPGIPGVGTATAARLLVKWGNLTALLDNTDKVPAMKFRGASRVAELLQEHAQTILNENSMENVFDQLGFTDKRRQRWHDLLEKNACGA